MSCKNCGWTHGENNCPYVEHYCDYCCELTDHPTDECPSLSRPSITEKESDEYGAILDKLKD